MIREAIFVTRNFAMVGVSLIIFAADLNPAEPEYAANAKRGAIAKSSKNINLREVNTVFP
jgi:uncharacterized protein (UPF0212 family)